jgi:putative ABC transport system permease protein
LQPIDLQINAGLALRWLLRCMIKNYLRVALRHLWRNRAFSLINILGLAVGLTAFFLISLWVSFETSYDNFHSKADRIYRIVSTTRTPTSLDSGGMTFTPIAPNLKKEYPEVEEAVRMSPDWMLVRRGNQHFMEHGTVMADSGLFRVFDFVLIAGDRGTALTAPGSVVLSQSTARKYFGNEDPMGKQLLVSGNGVPMKVTAVMQDIPENSQIRADLFVSLSSYRSIYDRPIQDSEWTNHAYYTYLLFRPHTDVAAFERKLPDFIERHHGEQSRQLQMYETLRLERLRDVYLRSKVDGFVTGSLRNVWIFSTIGVFILLIACINFVNLTTARSTERAKEVGVRKVIGAGRFQLARQFIGESVLICGLAFAMALLLAGAVMPVFNILSGKTVSAGVFSHPLGVAYLFGLSLLIGIIAGFYPSMVLSGFRPVTVLKGRFATGARGLLLRRALVVFQFVISTVLIVGTIVVYHQVHYMQTRDLGFAKDQELIIDTNFDPNKGAFKASLAGIPGVLSTCFGSGAPGNGYTSAYTTLEDRQGKMQQVNIDTYFVDFDYIRQYGLQVLSGRPFSPGFSRDTGRAMVINESAMRMLGYRNPQEVVGRNFDQWGRQGKIIGVIKNFNYKSLRESIAPMVMRVEPWAWLTVSVKLSATDLPATIASIGRNWNRLIPTRPFEYSFLDEDFNKKYSAEAGFGRLFFYFAALAIFISCLGVLGLASYSTIQRRKEIGVRKVLGASAASIVEMLSKDFLRLVGLALLIASPVGWWVMDRWLSEFAYRAPIAWWVFGATAGVSLVVVFVTIGVQAVRAALENPTKALRSE